MNSQNELRLKGKEGFTLIEILVSVVIIAITAVMLTTNVSQSFVVYQGTQDIIKSSDLAQKYIEQVKANLKYATNYDAVYSGTTPPLALTSVYTDNGYYTVATNVDNLDSGIVNGSTVTTLKEITVSYSKTSDSEKLVEFSTIISRPEN